MRNQKGPRVAQINVKMEALATCPLLMNFFANAPKASPVESVKQKVLSIFFTYIFTIYLNFFCKWNMERDFQSSKNGRI